MLRFGVDLGGTKTEAIALSESGTELWRKRVPTARGDYAGTVATIAGLIHEAEAELGAEGSVGVGIPGTIVRATGLVKNANSTWLNGRPLQHDLSQTLHREVRCANDANCFTISEAQDGAAQGAALVFGVILGTGCGGGIALSQTTYSGPNGLAGEWGHMPLPWPTAEEVSGPACYCGHAGCLETWISGTGFEAEYARVTGHPLSGRDIVAAMRAGAPDALAAFARLQDRIARGLAVLVDVLDPDVIVVGGGLSNIDELYSGEVERLLSGYTFGGGTHTPIRKNLHGDASGVRGAAWLWPA